MEVIHQIIIEALSGGFWNFVGYWLLIALILGIPARALIYITALLIGRKVDDN